MDYLNKVLGIEITYENTISQNLPNFISTRYDLQAVGLDEKKVIFVYPKTELEQITTLKKHIDRIQKSENLPAVLVLKGVTFRQKEYLIREKIPFIVDGKQIYLPFMALYLQERCNAEKQERDEILPSSQMLLLHFIYNGAKEMSTSQAARELELTSTSISRASRQLEEMGLLQAKKMGVKKILFSESLPKDIFKNAEKKLVTPVKRTIYISKELAGTELPESGYSALAEYSMLNLPNIRYYASDKISQWKAVQSDHLQDSRTQVAVELWRYDPRKLSKRKIVDELSLALSLRKKADERVEEAIEEMLNNLWRRLDDYRN